MLSAGVRAEAGVTMNYRQLIGKAEAIVAIGMPGLYRVLAFACIQKVYSLEDLGRAASAFSVAQILAFFTAIGWASLILVRIPAADNRDDRVQQFYELAGMALVSLLILSVASGIGTAMFGVAESAEEMVVILVGWSFYQLSRHYFLALRAYRRIIGYDTFLLVSTGLYLIGCRRIGMAAGFPLGMALATTGILMLLNIGWPRRMPRPKKFEFKGLEFGFTNFLSGGVALSFVPIANYTNGASFAGVISLIASFSAMSALIPRAITVYRLPELSKLAGAGRSLLQLTSQTAREIALACVVAFAANVVIVVAIVSYEGSPENFWYTLICGVVLCAQVGISMLGSAYSSVLMVREESRQSVFVNLISCSAFAGALVVFYGVSSGLNFAFALSMCVLVTVWRNLMLKSRSAPLLARAIRRN
jgi:hypothetical protein